jgi:transcriptional regulator with XRE-family HTH domain
MDTMKAVKPDQILNLLRKKKGDRTAKELAHELGVTQQYLSDVFAGRREPGPAIIAGLGLEKEVVYKPVQ